MAKFYGKVGYGVPTEIKPGVWDETIDTLYYSGDVIRNARSLVEPNTLNDDIRLSNQFSIISDPYAEKNYYSIKFIEYMGTAWKVTNVEVLYPRLLLTIGGVYNGKQA